MSDETQPVPAIFGGRFKASTGTRSPNRGERKGDTMEHTYRTVLMVTVHPVESEPVALISSWACEKTWTDAQKQVQVTRDHHVKFGNDAAEVSTAFHRDEFGECIAFKHVWTFTTSTGIRFTDAMWIVRER